VITVFYDGKCGLCRREITHYRNIAPEGIFEWVDITVTPAEFNALGFSLSEGLKALHVRDNENVIHKGVDAFIIIWQALPRWRMLAGIVGLPFIRPAAASLYTAFAAWRFNRLGYEKCDLQ
jgi:predicted DCC family thiol-disulfide oxidoreductase YuxK